MPRDFFLVERINFCEFSKKHYSTYHAIGNRDQSLKTIFGFSDDDIAHMSQEKKPDVASLPYQVVR